MVDTNFSLPRSILDFNFSCNEEQGALLACTSSADLVELHTTAALQRFLIENAGAVYRYSNNIQPLRTEESLYIITACVKSDGWSLAAFRGAKSNQHLKLSKLHAGDDSTDIGKMYDWTNQGPAEAHLWPSTEEQAKDREKNQSLFLQGFKLAFSAPFRARMDGLDTHVPEGPSNSDQRKDRLDDPPSGPSGGNQSGSGDAMPGGSSNSSSTTSGGFSFSNQMQVESFPDTVGFLIPTFRLYFAFLIVFNQVHPCDTINNILLEMVGPFLVFEYGSSLSFHTHCKSRLMQIAHSHTMMTGGTIECHLQVGGKVGYPVRLE
jgi:hypothetical protein